MTQKIARYFRSLPPVSRRIAVTAVADAAYLRGYSDGYDDGHDAGQERGWKDREALYVVERHPVPAPAQPVA